MELAKKLTALRKDKGLTQIEVAEELNVSRQAVSKWEVGDTVPSTANLKYLARLYEVPLEYLFNEDAASPPEERTVEALAGNPADEGDKDYAGQVRFWKGLAVAAMILCVILSAILLYIKVFEKSGNLPNTNQTTEIKEGSIELNPGGGFDLEW
jgi:transcriptional regulator with XRE-family HTH domain